MTQKAPHSALRESLLDVLVAIVALCFIGYQLFPLLQGVEPAGWDLTGHLFVYREFLSNLSHGHVQGYDFLWGSGYPTFYLYPPLAYFIAALPHLLSFGMISELYSFDLSIVAVAVFTLVTLHHGAHVYFGKRAAPWAVLLGTFLLATPPQFDYLGVGLGGALSTGLFGNFIVLPFFILFIAYIEKVKTEGTLLTLAIAGLTLFAIFETHTMTFLFAVWAWAWSVCLAHNNKHRLKLLAIAALGLLLCTPSMVGFLHHMPYSSGKPAGLWGPSPDPLFPLFSGLTPSRIWESLSRAFESMPALPAEASGGLPPVPSPFQIPFILIHFPYVGIIFLISLCCGLVSLIKSHRLFLPVCYLVSIILLPRSFLASDIPLAIHYYRFIQPIAILQLFICAHGCLLAFDFISARKRVLGIRPFLVAAILFLVLAVVAHDFLAYSLTHRSFLRDAEAKPYQSYFTIDASNYPMRVDAEELMLYLNSQHPSGLVATETADVTYRTLGSPHFFSSQLALRYGIRTVPGLLAESMLSSSYINPVMMQGSEHLHWGEIELAGIGDFTSQPIGTHLERLELLGAQYIISTSGTYFATLTQLGLEGKIKLVRTFGSFGLFELPAPRPLAERVHFQPFLFISPNPEEFRDLSRRWFTNPRFFEIPIIYTPKSFEQLSAEDQAAIGGFIFTSKQATLLDPVTAEVIRKSDKPVIILTKAGIKTVNTTGRTHFVPLDNGLIGTEVLRQTLSDLIGTMAPATLINAHFEEESIVVESKGTTLIRASFGPNWRVENSKRTVFWVTPYHILVFGDGNIRLQYGG